MEPILPFWFKQRQCKFDAAGDNTFKVTAPNLGENYLRVFAENDRWKAAIRPSADGADAHVTTDTFATPKDAWEAAFELYRNHVII